MEDTLRDNEDASFAVNHIVLILVLMEDTLREAAYKDVATFYVLILVLMEDTLRDLVFFLVVQ